MSESGGNPFPHDGDHGADCTGYGCNCDSNNYGFPNRGPNGNPAIMLFNISISKLIIVGHGGFRRAAKNKFAH